MNLPFTTIWNSEIIQNTILINQTLWHLFLLSNFIILTNIMMITDPIKILFLLITIILINNFVLFTYNLKIIPIIFLIIYIGAITILFLFIVILINFKKHTIFFKLSTRLPNAILTLTALICIQKLSIIICMLIILIYFNKTYKNKNNPIIQFTSNTINLITTQSLIIFIIIKTLAKLSNNNLKQNIFQEKINNFFNYSYFVENNELLQLALQLYNTEWITILLILSILLMVIIASIKLLQKFF